MGLVRSTALVALLAAPLAATLTAACGGAKSSRFYTASPQAAYGPSYTTTMAEDGDGSGDTHVHHGINPWVETAKDNLSTFAADVDTASYTVSRRHLNEGTLPPAAAVRVEEYVNYFRYAFPPAAPSSPFSVVMDAAPSLFEPGLHVLRVGVATPVRAERKQANLVFLVDVSGSMQGPDRLELAKQSLQLLVENLRPDDTVALVTYAGSTRVVLPATPVAQRDRIQRALGELSSGGSTAMGAGLDLAYAEAMKGLRPGAVSRVIVLSDGDANVGTRDPKGIQGIIAERVQAGITVSTVGFGMGNYRGSLMEQLADTGNGNAFYVDSLEAARRIFSAQLAATLEVAAKDVKLQVEFDPVMVSRYRLVGYENRTVADADFRKDQVDAGEIGMGHQVTAMYVVELTEQGKSAPAPLGLVRIRHKAPEGQVAAESTFAMAAAPAPSFDAAAPDLRFASAVAAVADVLRGAEDAQRWSLGTIAQTARAAAGQDPDRLELVALIEKAAQLRGTPLTVAR
ncbi:MAG TPA: von Willebrand factor type A domain-containing protein [Kofleriaceae bacterium]|nr:von Willebrand factor type A domain-containing protein [Kofleriaceae bacterium]